VIASESRRQEAYMIALECALAMIDAGANRIGTSCGVSIMQELHSDNKPIQQVRLLWF
jgi:hypothetical protein